MKDFGHIFFFGFLLLIFASCTRNTDHPVILQAEKIMYDHPDSAYQLLNSIPHPEKLPREDYAAWCLQYSQAQYKLYIDIKSDSLIKVAVDYYAKSSLQKESGTAYYMLGCISELLNKKEEAMLAYKNATNALEGIHEYRILGLTYFNMGFIYYGEGNYYQAKACYKYSSDCFDLSGDKDYQIKASMKIASTYYQLDYPMDSLDVYTNKALKLVKEIKDTAQYYYLLGAKSELMNKSDYKKAIYNVRQCFFHLPNNRVRYASFLAYMYAVQNVPDSAAYFFKIGDEKKINNEMEMFKYVAKGAVYEKRGDFKTAYFAIEKAFILRDTLLRSKIKNQIYLIDKQYDVSKKEKENNELKISNRTKVIWIGVLVIIVLIGLMIFQRVNHNHKKKEAELQLKQQETEFILREQELQNQTKFDLLLTKLQQRVEITLRFNHLQQRGFDPKKQEDMITSIANQVILVESEWQYYIDETNRLYNNRIVDLQLQFKELTRADLIVIVLIILGLDISDACCLLNSSKDTMYMRRKRIKKRLKIEEDLEEWIRNHFRVI